MRSPSLILALALSVGHGALRGQVADPSFGTDGYTTVDVNGGDEQFFDVAVQPDGKVLAAGTVWGLSNGLALVCRFMADGALDPTFSGDGAFIDGFGNADAEIRGVALQPDGKVLLAGSVSSWDFGTTQAFVLRLNSNGTMDGSFGVGGYAMLPSTSFTHFNEVAVDGEGNIVAVGMQHDGGGDLLVVRFDPNGELDASFDDAGLHVSDIGAYWDELYDVRIMDDGSIVCAGGTNDDGQNTTAVLLKLSDEGLAHPDFAGGAGFVEPTGAGAATGLHVLPDGRIVAAVAHAPGMQPAVVRVVRTQADGSPDASFGTAGHTDLALGTGDCMWAGGVHADAAGHVLVGGNVRVGCNGVGNFFLAALWPDGSVNDFFGNNGYFVTTNAALASGGAVDAPGMAMLDGRVLLASSTMDGTLDGLVLAVGGAALGVTPTNSTVQLQLRPQPAGDAVWLPTSLGPVVDEVIVFDATGRAVLVERLRSTAVPLDVSTLPNGPYTVVLNSTLGVHNAKLLVQR
ncbi:MAG: hypothetical protein IPJ76_13400 [Flavobacteriales bacterium]|nr:MAG: hypothetical protein IPJ76_13400 [Flavobacteriales bacterium]